MHLSSFRNARRFFETYAGNLKDATVVDIGSRNVNGSIKDVCPPRFRYVGVDFEAGAGVDVVLDDPYKLPFADGSVDVVVTNSCFEHSEFFWLLFLEIVRILKPHGLFYLNAPSNGPFHRYPVDCWRFYPDSARALVSWAKRNGYDPLLLESFTSRQDFDVFSDFVAVICKDRAQAGQYVRRIVDSTADFSNGSKAGSEALLQRCDYPEDQRGFWYGVKRKYWRLANRLLGVPR